MKFTRRYTTADRPVEEQIEWKTVTVTGLGKAVAVPEVEVPVGWSDNASAILADKYLRKAGVPSDTIKSPEGNVPRWLLRSSYHLVEGISFGLSFGPETSAKQVFHRLAGCWTYWGWKEGYFRAVQGDGHVLPPIVLEEMSERNARAFYDEVYMMLALQIAAPNSPQWFSTGLWWAYGIDGPDSGMWYCDEDGVPKRIYNSYERNQPHACFLTPTADHLVNEGGIMDTWHREARIFKHGSGSGVNVSAWRGENEGLSGGGFSSGVMGWLRIGDSAAGAIHSGGTTRRAAKLVLLDDDHPDLPAFIDWKVKEEYKAAAMYVGSQVLKRAAGGLTPIDIDVPQQMLDRFREGFEPEVLGKGFEEEANRTIDGQNSNNSVRVTDAFMRATETDEDWHLTARTTGEVVKTIKASKLWDDLCRAAWACADPGLLFHDTINEWHTTAADGPIRTSNPCFTGDTLVWTTAGPRRFDELAASGDTVQVLTELPDGKLAYRDMVRPRMTRRATRVVKLTLNSRWQRGLTGRFKETITTLRLTGDHEVFLSTGERCRADRLRPGDSVESVYRQKANQKGYISLRSTSGDRVMEHHLAAEYTHGRRPVWPEEHGHHLDEIKDRNVPGNIAIVPASDHNSEHMLGDRNPMRRWFGSLSEEDRAAHVRKMSAAASGENNPNYGNAGHLADRIWINDGKVHRRIKPEDGIPDGWVEGKTDLFKERVKASWVKRRVANHTVVSVEVLPELEDVYCGTVPATGRFFVSLVEHQDEGILVSNCCEFHSNDGNACNLASLRLTAFLREDGTIDLDAYEHATRLFTVVLDISNSMASFPAREFAVGAYNYRTIGLGYMDLGGLLMRMALPYDSDEGRALAAALTALMTGVAYRTSAEMAEELGPFPRWEANEAPFRAVMQKHRAAVDGIMVLSGELAVLIRRAKRAWIEVVEAKSFRNAQTTLQAPTGTIHLVTDCDTSGIEPDYALVKHKRLAGGGSMRIVNRAVEPALRRLGYDDAVSAKILAFINEVGLPNGGGWLKLEHLPVFACVADLEPMAHVKMLAAIQPFLSGASSKTINLPNSATVDDVKHVYRECWRLGVKAVALYRDGSKLAQPLEAAKPVTERGHSSAVSDVGQTVRSPDLVVVERVAPSGGVSGHLQASISEAWRRDPPPPVTGLERGQRESLPTKRRGYRQKARIGGQTFYLSTGEYEDGRLGEIFLGLSGAGTTLDGFANSLAKVVSIALQYGVPASEIVDSLTGIRFDPSGFVELHDDVKHAHSIPDFIARDVAISYLGRDDLSQRVRAVAVDTGEAVVALDRRAVALAKGGRMTGQTCPRCGGQMIQTGTCMECVDCWESTGGCGG